MLRYGGNEMTEEQINQHIAEACGWTVDKRGFGWLSPNGYYTEPPDYYSDLNAMHEAEKALTYIQLCNYIALLIEFFPEAAVATARQRAEAFLRTLGKWEATDKESLTVQPITEKSSAVQSTSSGGSGGTSTYGGKGLGIAGRAWPPETRITVNGKTFCLADIDKEMTE